MASTGTRAVPGGRGRRLLVAGIGGALLVAAVLAALILSGWPSGAAKGGTGPTAPSEIDLLPSVGTRSTCIVDTPGEPRPILPLAYGALQANTYSVPTGTVGHVGMCYNATDGALFSYANWTKVGAAGGWFSYPQVAYGVDQYLGALTTYTNQSGAWALPQTVA